MNRTNPTTAKASERNEKIFEFLTTHPVGVLSLVDPNNNPHATVIYFSVDTDFNIFFTTKSDTHKHDNLKHNKHAMFTVFEPVSQTTVQIIGEALLVDGEAKSQEVFRSTVAASMATSEGGIPPISKLQAGDYVAYQLTPKQIRMAVYVRPDSGGYEMFETIDLDN